MSVSVVILAAGQGTRMRSDIPKVLHNILGKPMIVYSIDNSRAISDEQPVVVIGHGQDEVRQHLGGDVRTVLQEQQLGTGHAVTQTEAVLKGESDYVLVIYADMPLLKADTLQKLVDVQKMNSGPLTILTLYEDDPRGFGRVLRDSAGNVEAIIEEAQANPEQLLINELNAGAYCINSEWLWEAVAKIEKSPKGEYYLTDLVGIAVSENQPVSAVVLENCQDAIGINNRVHLAEASRILQNRINTYWMENGVAILDPERTYIEESVEIGPDTQVWPDCYLKGDTKIGQGNIIGPGTTIEGSEIGNLCKISQSVVEHAVIEDKVKIGPFSHMRKGAHLASRVHIGNYGEVKNSYLGTDTKMGHFSYIGDATIGENVNIGAGTITCNFDGEKKNKTRIGSNVFIGSDTMLVAPLELGDGSKTGAGSVVTKNVAPKTLVAGIPARAIRNFKENE